MNSDELVRLLKSDSLDDLFKLIEASSLEWHGLFQMRPRLNKAKGYGPEVENAWNVRLIIRGGPAAGYYACGSGQTLPIAINRALADARRKRGEARHG